MTVKTQTEETIVEKTVVVEEKVEVRTYDLIGLTEDELGLIQKLLLAASWGNEVGVIAFRLYNITKRGSGRLSDRYVFGPEYRGLSLHKREESNDDSKN